MTDIKQIEQDTTSNNSVWDYLRYFAIVAIIGGAIFYYYIQKPVVYAAQETRGMTMGTDYVVKVADFVKGKDHDAWKNFSKLIQQRLDQIDHAMSTYRSDSEVSRFNAFNPANSVDSTDNEAQSETTEWFTVSKETAEVVQLSLEISKLSEGAFDITVAPLVELWGFGHDKTLFTAEELETKSVALKSQIGYDKLEVRMNPPAIKKLNPELRIDLSAIAKGYGVDCVARLLEENGYKNYMIEVGGEVRCRGNKMAAGHWNIGIEKPLLETNGGFPGLQRQLSIGDNAMATSGDYQNYRLIDGKKYSHIIDPRIGYPTERFTASDHAEPTERLGSVTIIADSCAKADALATALFVLGEEHGIKLAEKQGIAALFLFRTENNERLIRESASSTFPKGK